jgi:RNA recognition motif-containing protein
LQGDPYKTLFVPRLSYEVTERKLRHEFEEFGPIKRIRLVHDRNAGETLCGALALLFAECSGFAHGDRHKRQQGCRLC